MSEKSSREAFFDEYNTVIAEPHQSAASIVPLPFAIISKSFWIRGEGPDTFIEPKNSAGDSVLVKDVITAVLNFAAKACPSCHASNVIDDRRVQICFPEASQYRDIGFARYWLDDEPFPREVSEDDAKWFEDGTNTYELADRLLSNLTDRAFELKFSPWANVGRSNQGTARSTSRIRILIRVEMQREILTVNMHLAQRRSADQDPLEAFCYLHEVIQENFECGGETFPAVTRACAQSIPEDRGERFEFTRQLRGMQAKVQEVGLKYAWEAVFEDKLDMPFTHFRGLVLNPRMYALEDSWKDFFESASRYTSRLNYRLSDPFNVLPPLKSRRIINFAGAEVDTPAEASRKHFRSRFKAMAEERATKLTGLSEEDRKQTIDAEIRAKEKALIESFSGRRPLEDLAGWEQTPPQSELIEGARLFLEAITGFQFIRRSYVEDREAFANSLQMHVPQSLIHAQSRDPIASMIGADQAILLTTAGLTRPDPDTNISDPGNSVCVRRDEGGKALPMYFHVYYLREQRVPICRLVRRQIEGGTFRFASLRYLDEIRKSGLILGQAVQKFDRHITSLDGGLFDTIRGRGVGVFVRKARLLTPGWGKRKESLVYRVDRSKVYRSRLEMNLALQRGQRIATWQPYADFLDKRVYQTLDYIESLADRLKILEAARFERRVRVATYLAVIFAALALFFTGYPIVEQWAGGRIEAAPTGGEQPAETRGTDIEVPEREASPEARKGPPPDNRSALQASGPERLMA